METQVIIVDKDNNVIGHKNRSELTTDDIYRVSAARIVDESGNILLAQRSRTKKNDPGKWGPAVAGTVEEGETYESNIIKEIKEEIGIEKSIDDLTASPIKFNDGKHKYFAQWFLGIYNEDKSLLQKQDEEVEELKRFTRDELQQELENNPEMFLIVINQILKEFSAIT